MGLVQKLIIELDQNARTKVEKDLRDTGKKGAEGAADEIQKTGPLFDKAWGSIKSGLQGVAAGVAAAFTVRAIVAFAAELYKLGADAGETASKFTTTFGIATAAATKFLEGFANKAGLSTTAGKDLIATIGAMVQGMGAGKVQSESLAEGILRLAGDLTSFHNVPIDQTFAALRSGLVGEFEPLRRFGIVLTAADVQQRALINTGKSHVDQLTALDKATAAFQLAQERAGVAVGDLDRTQDSAVNTLRRMNAEWVDAKTALGEALVAAVNQSGAIEALGGVVQDLSGWVKENKAEIIDWVGSGLKLIVDGIKGTVAVFGDIFDALDTLGDKLDAVDVHWNDSIFFNGSDAGNVIRNTGEEFRKLGIVFDLVGEAFNRSGMRFGVATAELAATILGFVEKVDRGIAFLLDHIPGMGAAAEAVRQHANTVKASIGDLDQFIIRQQTAIKTSLVTTGELHTQLAKKQTEETTESTESMGADYKALDDTASTSLKHTSDTGQAKVKELSDTTKRHMKDMADAYAFAGKAFEGQHVGAILRGRDATIDAYKDMQKTAVESSADMAQAAENVEKAWRNQTVPSILQGSKDIQDAMHAQRDAVDAITDAVHAGTAMYTDDHVPSILRGSRDIDDALHQQAAAAEGVTDTFRGGEQYYVDQHVPAILQGQGAIRKSLDETGRKGQESAQQTESGWVTALTLINSAIGNVSNVFGGFVGKALDGLKNLVGGASSVAGAFKAFSEVTATGITGIIGKVAALSGGLAGIIGLLGAVKSVFEGVKDILGVGRSDPFDSEIKRRFDVGDMAGLEALLASAPDEPHRKLVQQAINALKNGQPWGSWWKSSGDPRQNPAPPPPSTPSTPTAPGDPRQQQKPRANNPFGFALGGLMPIDGMARLHANELVLPPDMTSSLRQLLHVQPVSPAGAGGSWADNRQLSVMVNLYGYTDDEVPQRVVEAVKQSIGHDYQKQAALQGNASLPG